MKFSHVATVLCFSSGVLGAAIGQRQDVLVQRHDLIEARQDSSIIGTLGILVNTLGSVIVGYQQAIGMSSQCFPRWLVGTHCSVQLLVALYMSTVS